MPYWYRLFAALFAISIAATPAYVWAAYPEKPIRLIVPYPAGTGTSVIAHYVAQNMRQRLGQPFVVDNKAGANAIIGTEAVVRAPADGYTLLFGANGAVSTNVAVYQKLPYDPVNDLIPVARLAYSPMGLYVAGNSPYKSAKELFETAKNRPGQLNYGSGSATYNVASEWLLSLAGAKATHVAYKGAALALNDLVGGQLDFVISEYSAALPMASGGKLRLLAVTTDRRLTSEPNIPTLQELGYKDYLVVAWWGIFAPKDTPPEVASRLEKAILEVFSEKETSDFLERMNFVPYLADSSHLRKFLSFEIERESRLVEQFRIPKQ